MTDVPRSDAATTPAPAGSPDLPDLDEFLADQTRTLLDTARRVGPARGRLLVAHRRPHPGPRRTDVHLDHLPDDPRGRPRPPQRRPGRRRPGRPRDRRAQHPAARRPVRRLVRRRGPAGSARRRRQGRLRPRVRAARRRPAPRAPDGPGADAVARRRADRGAGPVLGRRRRRGPRIVEPGLDGHRRTTAGANSSMHMVEAFLAAAAATGDASWPDRALRIADPPGARRGAPGTTGGCPSTSPPTGRRCPTTTGTSPPTRSGPYGSTIGHWLEWARLLLELEAVLPQPPRWLLADARALFAAAVRGGWAVDGADGFVYTIDWDDRPVVRSRMHWVLAEAIGAAIPCTGAPGTRSTLDWYRVFWAYAAPHVSSTTTGWRHELDAQNLPADTVWHGRAGRLPRLPGGTAVPRGRRARRPRPARTGRGDRVIVVAGEALIDLVVTADGQRAVPGGSPANVAVTLARLDQPVRLLARLGTDEYGRQLVEHLSANRVDLGWAVRAEEPTSVAVATLNATGQASYEFRLAGAADWQWTPQELPELAGSPAIALHTGSLALALAPGAQVLEGLLARERQPGRAHRLDRPQPAPEHRHRPGGGAGAGTPAGSPRAPGQGQRRGPGLALPGPFGGRRDGRMACGRGVLRGGDPGRGRRLAARARTARCTRSRRSAPRWSTPSVPATRSPVACWPRWPTSTRSVTGRPTGSPR